MSEYDQVIIKADEKASFALDELHAQSRATMSADTQTRCAFNITLAICRTIYWSARVIAAAIAKQPAK